MPSSFISPSMGASRSSRMDLFVYNLILSMLFVQWPWYIPTRWKHTCLLILLLPTSEIRGACVSPSDLLAPTKETPRKNIAVKYDSYERMKLGHSNGLQMSTIRHRHQWSLDHGTVWYCIYFMFIPSATGSFAILWPLGKEAAECTWQTHIEWSAVFTQQNCGTCLLLVLGPQATGTIQEQELEQPYPADLTHYQ